MQIKSKKFTLYLTILLSQKNYSRRVVSSSSLLLLSFGHRAFWLEFRVFSIIGFSHFSNSQSAIRANSIILHIDCGINFCSTAWSKSIENGHKNHYRLRILWTSKGCYNGPKMWKRLSIPMFLDHRVRQWKHWHE